MDHRLSGGGKLPKKRMRPFSGKKGSRGWVSIGGSVLDIDGMLREYMGCKITDFGRDVGFASLFFRSGRAMVVSSLWKVFSRGSQPKKRIKARCSIFFKNKFIQTLVLCLKKVYLCGNNTRKAISVCLTLCASYGLIRSERRR